LFRPLLLVVVLAFLRTSTQIRATAMMSSRSMKNGFLKKGFGSSGAGATSAGAGAGAACSIACGSSSSRFRGQVLRPGAAAGVSAAAGAGAGAAAGRRAAAASVHHFFRRQDLRLALGNDDVAVILSPGFSREMRIGWSPMYSWMPRLSISLCVTYDDAGVFLDLDRACGLVGRCPA
jgi:hypothetical protein